MPGWTLLLDFVVILAAATLLGIFFERIRLGAVLGAIVAGIAIGPGGLSVVGSTQGVALLAEMGVALLLFSIGLEFSFRRLRRQGRVALIGGTGQIVLTVGVVTAVVSGLGAGFNAALAVGAALCLSSTAVILRTLRERDELDATHGRNALGILLLQDIAVVPLVLLMALLAGKGKVQVSGVEALTTVGTVVLGATVFVAVLLLILPRLMDASAMTANRELPILLAVIVCAGAAWSAHALQLSPALGAFAAGLLLAETAFSEQIRADVAPLKALFVTLFFASVGMLADLRWMGANLGLLVGGTAALVVAKVVVTYLVLRWLKVATIVAFATALTIGQAGEFAFVLGGIARGSGVISEHIFQALTSCAILSLLLTPLMVATAPTVARWMAKRLIPARRLAQEERAQQETRRLSGHIVQIGYGDSGRAAVEKMRELGLEIVVLEINPRFYDLAREHGLRARLGDATQADILQSVSVAAARAVSIAVPDHRATRIILSQVRNLAPKVPTVARSRYSAYADELCAAGADIVVDEERSTGTLLGLHATVAAHEDSKVVSERPDAPAS